MAWKVSHSETKPFSGGSAEMAMQPIRKVKAVSGMLVDESAEMLHVALAGRAEHRARAEEQEVLEQRVVEDVQQRRGEGERRGPAKPEGLETQREAEADEDDADILDRVIGEQPLQIMLHQRVEHAHDAGDAGKRQHQHAPPPFGRPEQIEHDAHEGIDRDLGHDAAQQAGDMARRGGVRERQPGMQRHETRLRARADQDENEHERREPGGRVAGADGVEGVVTIGPASRPKASSSASVPKLAITR